MSDRIGWRPSLTTMAWPSLISGVSALRESAKAAMAFRRSRQTRV